MSLLQKHHISPKSIEITARGSLNTMVLQPISQYEQFDIAYNVECRNIGDQEAVSEAVLEAHNEKCGVIAMLRKIAPVSHEISVISTE
jgi:putative redox protein